MSRISRRNAGCKQLANVQHDRHPAEHAHPDARLFGGGEQPHCLGKDIVV